MVTKKIVITAILTLAFGLIQQVTSFTGAMVKNTALLSVSNSENALVAIPKDLALEVTKEITTTTRIIMSKGTEEKIFNVMEEAPVVQILPCASTFYVKNNMGEVIYVDAYIDKGFLGDEIQGLTIKKTETGGIMPGETQEFSFDIDESIKNGIVGVLVFVRWANGSAEIKSKIIVDVREVRNEVVEYEYIEETQEEAADIKSENKDTEPGTVDAQPETTDKESEDSVPEA